MPELYIGLLSGTSADGVDAALVEIDRDRCRVIAATTTRFPAALQARIDTLILAPTCSLAALGALDAALGDFFGGCAVDLLATAGVARERIAAVGHHGQTVLHEPAGKEATSIQIGDPNRVAAKSGLVTVADFRRLDMAYGGQGAPLMCAFHDWLLQGTDGTQVVVNIGGIANVTLRRPGAPLLGFDTGPGNTLMDLWISKHLGRPFDHNGEWAAGGQIDASLLQVLLDDDYFRVVGPKSTGREYFNLGWLNAKFETSRVRASPQDIMTTLCELTAASIAEAILHYALCNTPVERVLLCGGGAYNKHLVERLARRLPSMQVTTTATLGIPPEWIEAAGFAWLARMRMHQEASSRPSVTGATRAATLGSVYLP